MFDTAWNRCLLFYRQVSSLVCAAQFGVIMGKIKSNNVPCHYHAFALDPNSFCRCSDRLDFQSSARWRRWVAGLDCQRLTVALFSLYSSRLIRLALYQCRASDYLHALEKFLTAMQINTTASQWFEFSFITSRCKTWPLVMSSYEKFKSNVYQSRN